MKFKTRNNIKGLAVSIPIQIYFAIFTIVPFAMLFYYSFTNLHMITGVGEFVGFKNFVDIFKYPEYFRSVLSTMIIAVAVVVFGMVFGFILAIMLKAIPKGQTFFRTIWYIPALLSLAIVSKIVAIMLSYDGVMNNMLGIFGVDPISWYDSAFWMYFWIIFIIVWKGMGSTALLYIAGLNGISKDVYEAADIDGAGKFKQVFSITIPLLRPMIGFILITGFIGAFNIFEPVDLISQGGSNGATKVILYRIYDEAFKNFKQGFSCALSVIVMLIVLFFTYVNMKITGSGILAPPVGKDG